MKTLCILFSQFYLYPFKPLPSQLWWSTTLLFYSLLISDCFNTHYKLLQGWKICTNFKNLLQKHQNLMIVCQKWNSENFVFKNSSIIHCYAKNGKPALQWMSEIAATNVITLFFFPSNSTESFFFNYYY